jgi:hypothetical protein
MATYPQITATEYTGDITLTGAGSGKVGIGSTDPQEDFYMAESADHGKMRVDVYSASVSDSAVLQMVKSATDTLGSKSATGSSDRLGLIEFFGVNSGGSSFANALQIMVEQDGSAGATYVPGKLSLLVSDGSSAPATALCVDSAGAMGVGTSFPTRRLHVKDTSNPPLKYECTTASGKSGTNTYVPIDVNGTTYYLRLFS